jgi:hypothetical protein
LGEPYDVDPLGEVNGLQLPEQRGDPRELADEPAWFAAVAPRCRDPNYYLFAPIVTCH